MHYYILLYTCFKHQYYLCKHVPYPVFCDISGELVGRDLQNIKEHVLLDVFVLHQKPLYLVYHWPRIVMNTW